MIVFKAADSGREVKLEEVAFSTSSLLRAFYERTTKDKPEPPVKEIKDVVTGEVVERVPNTQDAGYIVAKSVWDARVNQRSYLARKILITQALKDKPDEAAVAREVERTEAVTGMDLREAIRGAYHDAEVPFDDALMDAYIFLWQIVLTNSGEQSAFFDRVNNGSQMAQDAAADARFRAQRAV